MGTAPKLALHAPPNSIEPSPKCHGIKLAEYPGECKIKPPFIQYLGVQSNRISVSE